MKNKIKLIVLFGTCYFSAAQAEMMKCLVQQSPEMTGYFEASDTVQRQKCLTEPVPVMTASGEPVTNSAYSKRRNNPISNPNSTPTQAQFSGATRKVASNYSPDECSGPGGTIKINGREFYMDPKLLCERYGVKGKGSGISDGYVARHVRLGGVNSQFRRKISSYVNKTARKYGMEPEFIHAVISAESAYNPNAKSHVGAMGLMQLMPFTAKRFGVTNAYDPYQNIDAGTRYLKILYDEFGSLELAAAGYNAGEGAVRKYNNRIPPYRETRKYVPKVMAYYQKYRQNQSLIASN